MKVVAFDLWGDYAHFRRFFTTSSPLTYSFPPPTTVRGIIGAVLGLDKNEYLKETADLAIGVRLLAPVKRVRWGQNLIFTKGTSGGFDPTLIGSRKGNVQGSVRTQVKVEYLKDSRFRLYIGGEGSLLEHLENLLRAHRTHYTLSLGLSELLADFVYVDTYQAESLPPGIYEVTTVFPINVLQRFERLEPGVKLGKECMPIYLSLDRTPLLYQDVVFEMYGRPLRVPIQEVHHLNREEVVYLWPPASTHTLVSS